jgi:hypothetical protein
MTPEVQHAKRFFWTWLIGATVASVAGNVVHALLGHAASPAVAAAAAIVPPLVLLGATHGVHALVQSQVTGLAYRAAMCITVLLALCAFILSFEALRDLAITQAGIPQPIGWLWPLAIDLSITGSTIALLALTGRARDQVVPEVLQQDAQTDPNMPVVTEHAVLAERIVSEGVTRIDRKKVELVLAKHSEGCKPSMIAREVGVGYETVQRITEHTERLVLSK